MCHEDVICLQGFVKHEKKIGFFLNTLSCRFKAGISEKPLPLNGLFKVTFKLQ